MDRGARTAPDLAVWIPDPSLRVAHRRTSRAAPGELWAAAKELALGDTGMLGRLIRWRIPGLARGVAFDRMFREPPFMVLEEDERSLVSGLVGRIWTLRRDYPQLDSPAEFRAWEQRGTVRVAFATWVHDGDGGGAEIHAEVRVQAFGLQGRVGVAAVRPLVNRFQATVGSEGLRAVVARAERDR